MTPAELAILSLLIEQPRHGYGIEQVIDERGMREWASIGFSSIYHILKKLERQGYIEGRLESREGKGPASKVYTLTEAGSHVWHTLILQALRTPQLDAQYFQVGLAALPLLTTVEVDDALGQYQQTLVEHRNRVYERLQQEQATLPFQVRGLFDLSLRMLDAQLGWLDDFRQQYKQQTYQEEEHEER